MAEYIDRDLAEKALLDRCNETGYGGLIRNDVMLVMRAPWRIPTADVAPVRHGRWSFKGEWLGWICSECEGNYSQISKYCPNCGARMGGKLMYDELIKRLRNEANCPDNYPEDSNLMREAADAIEELEFACNRYEKDYKALCAYLPKWIPVTERLPEEKKDGFSKDVLILIEELDGDMVWRDIYVGYYLYDAVSDETGWWVMMTCDCVKVGEHRHDGKIFKRDEKVTHWMPLPQPPKGD